MGNLLGAPSPASRRSIVTAQPPHTLIWTIVDAVNLASAAPDGVVAFAIDSPRPGARTPGAGLEIDGWVIGRGAPVVGVRATAGDRPETTRPLDVRRPDVAADYPDSPAAGTSGFSFWISLPSVRTKWSFAIEAVFADRSAMPGWPRCADTS